MNPPKSSARIRAEAQLDLSKRRDDNFRLEQKQSYEATILKTQRLRELRLAKEAAEKEVAAQPSVGASSERKIKRSRQT